MQAWKGNLGINDEVLLLSDGYREFTMKIRCEMELSDNPVGLGVWPKISDVDNPVFSRPDHGSCRTVSPT
ncbi:hypothetical protein CRYUN_Cryun25bG0079300 [Craigia yunnanensis]